MEKKKRIITELTTTIELYRWGRVFGEIIPMGSGFWRYGMCNSVLNEMIKINLQFYKNNSQIYKLQNIIYNLTKYKFTISQNFNANDMLISVQIKYIHKLYANSRLHP